MSAKLMIGITGDYRPGRNDGQELSWFNSGYYDSVVAAGGIPVLIPPMADDADLKVIFKQLDGLVLAGCALDLDPIRLGFDPHPATRAMPTRREDFDRRIARLAVDQRMPLLAIGSGMQTLNVVCGGTLHQHVQEDVPKALYHRDPVEKDLRHVLEIVPGTRVDAIYGPGEIRVNSRHHMGINQPAPHFKVSATCPDGVIEAIESIDEDWFCLAVQWHPEDNTSSALDAQVFDHFLEGCKPQPEILPMTNEFRRAA